MRRIVAIAALLATATLAVFGQAASGEGDEYEVRAIFDNGGFVVPGEQVRVAGANVGSVSSVDVTLEGEQVHRDGTPDPGKAVVVMKIDDAGFQDFRRDATCLIRPQSLLGEKYVDCQPTLPRAPGSPAPPALEPVPDGEPGAGQHFLPLENNGKAVDADLINNILEEPYAQRFRLIFNDLGAAFAARGDDLDAIIRRANPALRQTNLVLAELARQNEALSRLARDGDTVLAPWARERRATAGFINNAQVAAEATAERSRDLEAGFQRFPEAMRQLRLTMAKLRAFADQAAPVFAEFRDGGPAIARATRALGPFAAATEPALTSLGTSAEQSRQPLLNSVPILRGARRLAESAEPGARRLTELLSNLRRTGFHENFMKLLYNSTGAINGYDQYGHFLRAWLLPESACTFLFDFELDFCDAHFSPAFLDAGKTGGPPSSRTQLREMRGLAKLAQSDPAAAQAALQNYLQGLQAGAGGQAPSGTGGRASSGAGAQDGARAPSMAATRALLDTVIGRRQSSNSSSGEEGGP